ncbi:MAG: sodium-dependent transporter, partial [Bacteroidales bacterium]|nr:sodium-dependent transporter [Bacteroidales bacterium]
MAKRDGFASSFGVLVAMAGSAVGLGNLWRFPYLVGTNGGAAFIIIYLAIVFVLAMPIMYSEFVIGRRAQSNVYGAFRKLAPGSGWGIIGAMAILCCILVVSFYSVVGGWTIDYLFKGLTLQFTSDSEALGSMFENTVTANWRPLLFMILFVGSAGAILLSGVKDGIEKYSKVLMPLLFVMVIVIAVRSVTLPGAGAGIDFLFKPNWSAVTANTFLDALGQAFFSLSVGFGIIFTYASYVKKEENLISMSVQTATADTLFTIIAGIAIMPAVFAFGIEPG